MNPAEPFSTVAPGTPDADPLTARTWDAETWNSVLDTTCGEAIVPVLAPIFTPGYCLARVQGNANEAKASVKDALGQFELFPAIVHLLSVSALQGSCQYLQRRLPEPLYRHLPDLLAETLTTAIGPDLEVTLRAHPDVARARKTFGILRWLRLEQALRTAFIDGERAAEPDPFFQHPVTDALGDRAARNVRFVLALAMMATLLRGEAGKPHRLEEAVQPLLSLVQAGYFPLGASFEGTLTGGYVVLVA